MLVKELIERLSKCNPSADVAIIDSDDGDVFRIIDIEEYGTVFIKV